MVGDDLVAGLGIARRFNAGCGNRGCDQRLEQIRFVVVVRALEHGGDALKSHAGVDRGLGQRDAVTGATLLELHEHEVPDFDEAVAIGAGGTGRAAFDLGSVVVENFRTRAARAGLTHLPEIV